MIVTRVRLLLLICLLASFAQAQPLQSAVSKSAGEIRSADSQDYLQLELAEIADAPDRYQGKLVAVTAQIISIDARYQAIRLFDPRSRKLLKISLARLPKGQRRSLLREPVHRVSVYGSVGTRPEQYVISAHKIVPIMTSPAAGEAGR